MHQIVGMGKSRAVQDQADHDFAGRKTFADQDMTDETFAGHFIVGRNFILLHEGKDCFQNVRIMGARQGAVADVDDIVRTAGVKASHDFSGFS